MGLQLAPEPGPQPAPVVQRPVSECPHTVMRRLVRWRGQLKQRDKRLLHDVLGFAMRKSQRTAVEDQLRGFLLIQALAPGLIRLLLGIQVLPSGHRRERNLYKFLGEIFRRDGICGDGTCRVTKPQMNGGERFNKLRPGRAQESHSRLRMVGHVTPCAQLSVPMELNVSFEFGRIRCRRRTARSGEPCLFHAFGHSAHYDSGG